MPVLASGRPRRALWPGQSAILWDIYRPPPLEPCQLVTPDPCPLQRAAQDTDTPPSPAWVNS